MNDEYRYIEEIAKILFKNIEGQFKEFKEKCNECHRKNIPKGEIKEEG